VGRERGGQGAAGGGHERRKRRRRVQERGSGGGALREREGGGAMSRDTSERMKEGWAEEPATRACVGPCRAVWRCAVAPATLAVSGRVRCHVT
jgi:hypothetical protein